MKNLIIFGLVVLAAWYGWKHYPELMHKQPGHDAVIENRTGRNLERVRLTVDGQTFVKEKLADDATAVIPFKVTNDATFQLTWEYEGQAGEQNWSGGSVPRGPMLQRHIFTIDNDGAVFYRAEQKLAVPK